LVAIASLTGGALDAAERVSAPARAGGSSRAADSANSSPALLATSTGLVCVALRMTVDGASLNRFRERFVERLFRELDQNHDGNLSEKELAKFLAQLSEQGAANRSTRKMIDVAPADKKISAEEFRSFLNRQLGPSVVLVTKTMADDGAVLFGQLDRNRDGALTRAELRDARRTLARLDADDDETISIDELKAAQASGAAQDGPEPSEEGPAKRRSKAPAEPAASGSALILVGPGSASRRDAGLPKIDISFQLFDQQRGRTAVSVGHPDRAFVFESKQEAADAATLAVNGLSVNLLARRTRTSTGDRRSYFAVRFAIVDADKNNYLDKKEFAALGVPDAEFEAVDANKDGQIVQDELRDFLSRTGTAPINQVIINVADESKSLFDFLDTRADRRLSPRELNAAPERLAALDRNKDGKLTLAELRTQIEITVEIKRPPAPRQAMNVLMPRPRSSAAVPRDNGPEWFLRMDRNYDGDVSWREFLGSKSAFDRLDANHDGLISPEEAGWRDSSGTAEGAGSP
jgi:Ca2+-binding EF-hand superfamily protein